ncbi:hypothetical protein ABT147_31280 [Streptomyces sp. NPDC001868]|uniref:hypothetical protein n=1 Tax=Streptomyces sp. NPDC001868 TaxID=3154401 RepID=UPI003330428A
MYNTLRDASATLEYLKQEGVAEGVEPHAGAAMWGVRFAAAVLYPLLPCQPKPPVDYDPQKLLDLAAHWRDAAFDLGEFALDFVEPDEPDEPAQPAREHGLRLVDGDEGSGQGTG